MATSNSNNTQSPHPKVRRYLLARHGQTNYNQQHRVQGTLDEGVVLTDTGISQATSLGVYLSNRMPIARTYCSPMQRCRQTFHVISNIIRSSPPQQSNQSLPPPIVLPNLREIELCEWQGRLRKDVAMNDIENWNVFKSNPTQLRLANGSFAPVLDCWERATLNWETIRFESTENNAEVVFIMCHGAMGQAMLLHSIGLNVELYGKSNGFGFDNCDCFEVEWMDGEGASRRWRRVYPVEGAWEECFSTQKMYLSGLKSCR